ncbi:MAG TPA: methyltransferase [Candidatus Polarisedimenticolaceae bacterium]|nr:methyltransferase [Candidatus Polarisedimenticolaceae bacterium]
MTPTQEEPLHAQVVQMATAYWVSRTVYAAAKLGLADHLRGGPKSAEELAGPTETHAPSLHRLMRTLASLGLLSEGDGRRFSLTPLGETLVTGAPGMARSTVLAMGADWMWASWTEFLHSVRTGETAFEKVWKMAPFDYLAAHPEDARNFGEAMIGIHGAEPPAVAAAYDFSKIGTLVDVGGGTGNLITTILRAHPHLKGILYDLPHVVEEARANVERAGVADRCKRIGGSFFESVPAGGDAYILSHVIHDWDEAKCLTILKHCRTAMGPKGTLLLVEMVLPAGNEPHFGKVLDMVMLSIPGGVERTAEEYGALLAKAGFKLTRIVPTESVVGVIEGVPA